MHLSRRFSGFTFLYVVLALFVYRFSLSIIVLNLVEKFGSISIISSYIVWISSGIYLLIAAIPLIVMVSRHCPPIQILRLRPFSMSKLFFSIGIAICLCFVIHALNTLLEALYHVVYPPKEPYSLLSLLFPQQSPFSSNIISIWPGILTVCLFPVIFDGVLFRGIIQSAFSSLRPFKICLIMGVLYALIEYSIWLFIPTFLVGFILSFLLVKTNSIFPSLIAHFVYIPLKQILSVNITAPHSILPSESAPLFSPLLIGIYLIALFALILLIKIFPKVSKTEDLSSNETNPIAICPEKDIAKQNQDLGFFIGSSIVIAYMLFSFLRNGYL